MRKTSFIKMFLTEMLWSVVCVGFFAQGYVFHRNNSSTKPFFGGELAAALEECSIPLPTVAESTLSSSRTTHSTANYNHIRGGDEHESHFAAYKRSATDFYDYDSEGSNSNRRNYDGRSHSKSDSNNYDDNNNSNNRYGSHGYSNTAQLGYGSNSKSDDKYNDSGYGSINDRSYNTTGNRKKVDVRIPYDDDNTYQSEETDMRNRTRNSGSNSRGSSRNSFRKRSGLQHTLDREKLSRITRETYNTGGDGVPACTIQCVLSRIQAVDDRGFPSESGVVAFLEKSLTDEAQRNNALREVHECFEKLRSEVAEDNCMCSKKLTDCMGLEFKKSSINVTA